MFRWILSLLANHYYFEISEIIKRKDNPRLEHMLQAVQYQWNEDFVQEQWNAIPVHLRELVHIRIRKLLKRIAKKPGHNGLSRAIHNAHACGIHLSHQRERRLYYIAMNNAEGSDKLLYANMLYRKNMQLPQLCKLLAGLEEYRSEVDSREEMEWFLERINGKEEDDLQKLLDVIAKNGRLNQLKAMCHCLRRTLRDLPTETLRACLNTLLQKKERDYAHITQLCILLDDQQLADRLIDQHPGNTMIAGKLSEYFYNKLRRQHS